MDDNFMEVIIRDFSAMADEPVTVFDVGSRYREAETPPRPIRPGRRRPGLSPETWRLL